MAKTFNRIPLSVNTPSSNDIKNYFFNHYTWKGVCDDRNFLAVDQETFAACDNVYMDAEGLLKSRPALKKSKIIAGALTLSSIVNFWSFDEIIVYLCKDGSVYNLYFVKDNLLLNHIDNFASSDLRLIIVKTKIFIFTATSLHYFNILNNVVGNAEDFIYVPKTKIISTTVETSNESPNVLTTSEIYVYLYNSIIGLPPTIIGKTVTVDINGISYEILFDKYTPDVLVNVKFNIDSAYNIWFTDDRYQNVNLAVSSENTYALYSYDNHTLLYSADGVTFKLVDTLVLGADEGVYSKPISFTQDSAYVYIVTNRTVHIVSVKADTNTLSLKFPTFTDIRTYITSQAATTIFTEDYESIYAASLFDFITYDDFAGVTGPFDNMEHEGQEYSYLFYFQYSNGVVRRRATNYIGSPLASQSCSFPEYIKYSKSFLRNEYDGCLLIYGAQSYPNSSSMPAHWQDILSVLTVVGFTEYSSDIIVTRTWLYDSLFAFQSFDAKIFDNKIIFVDVGDDSHYRYYVIDSDLTLSSPLVIYKSVEANWYRHRIFLSTTGDKLLTDQYVYNVVDNTYKSLIVMDDEDNNEGVAMAIPLAFTDYVYYIIRQNDGGNYTQLYTSYFSDTVEFEYAKTGTYNYFLPSHIAELTNEYLAKNNTLYISEYRETIDGNFQWYLPKINEQKFNYNVTNLQPLSQTEMGVFLGNEIWYVYLTDNGYAYNKTKLQVGIKQGSDVITAYDGSRLLFACDAGFAALSYQDFVATTEQKLTLMSDKIYSMFKAFNDSPIKIVEYDLWIILYKQGFNKAFIFDTRHGAWWPITSFAVINKIVKYGDKLYILIGGNVYTLSHSDNDYFDFDGTNKHKIPWSITSQKLHLNGLNYYKHITNLTFTSVLEQDSELSFNLDVYNYRKNIDSGKPEIVSYIVNAIRTYVQRLNYAKVNEFQYVLTYDEDSAIQVPLSLSTITVKYKITGQVR